MVIFFKYPKGRGLGDRTPGGICTGQHPAHSRPSGHNCLNEVTGRQISAHSNHPVLPSHKKDSLGVMSSLSLPVRCRGTCMGPL